MRLATCNHRRIPFLVTLCLLLWGGISSSSAAPADGPAATGAATASPAASSPQPAAAGDDFNFDLMGENQKSPEQIKEEQEKSARIERLGKIRRPMLSTHQIMGFVTLAALTATVVVGQLNHYDMYLSGDQTGRYRYAHLGLGIGTAALFGSTGFLAVFAPNPYPKPVRFDTALLHKVAMILATAGMATQIILGPIAVDRIGRVDQSRLALGHVITGYATWAFMTTGMIAYLF
ncbi:MAG: hypothetical protein JNJ46_11145 [Myxococcales bacterium]|nr:hypothetical protein [Myxococcales bacterium]